MTRVESCCSCLSGRIRNREKITPISLKLSYTSKYLTTWMHVCILFGYFLDTLWCLLIRQSKTHVAPPTWWVFGPLFVLLHHLSIREIHCRWMNHKPCLYSWIPVPSTAHWLHRDILWECSPAYESFSDMPRNNLGMCSSWHKWKACQGLFSSQ